MRRSVVDERENRRGLVLGLTLAEVLLLLLFLIMLGLADRLRKTEVELGRSISNLETLNSRLPQAGSISANQIAEIITESTLLESKLSELTAMADRLAPILQAAAVIDPLNPPAVLVRAMEALLSKGAIASGSITNQTPESVAVPSNSNGDINLSKGAHNWPPIITLSEANGHHFQSGSTELSEGFRSILRTNIAQKLTQIIAEYKVDVIEVVGHTDEQPIPERRSNLDRSLVPYLSTGADQLNPADNAGLGLARAVSVVRELATDKRLSSARLLPLSGGQLIDIGDQLSSGASPGAVKERRRIEIRVRRSAAYTAPTEVVIPPPKDQPKASELNFQGEELLRAGRPVEALEYFSSALALDPSYTLAMANRGLAHHRAKNLGAALKDYSSAIALKHEGAYVWTSRGIAKFDSGDFKGASADLDRAIGIEPNIHSALYQVISQNRQEKPGLKKFIEHLAQLRLSETSFFLQITNLYQGGSTISQVRAAAKTTRERCEAEFYVGQLLVVTKRLLDARSAFQSAVAFCDPSSFEHHTAAIELTRVHSTP